MTKFFHPAKPCNTCPFRREGGIRLRTARIHEIVAAIAPDDHRGSSFSCHSTCDYNGEDGYQPSLKELACTGGLIFAYKQGKSAQLTRIMERLGQIDPKLCDETAWPDIFDDIDEMLAMAVDKPKPGRKRARKRPA